MAAEELHFCFVSFLFRVFPETFSVLGSFRDTQSKYKRETKRKHPKLFFLTISQGGTIQKTRDAWEQKSLCTSLKRERTKIRFQVSVVESAVPIGKGRREKRP